MQRVSVRPRAGKRSPDKARVRRPDSVPIGQVRAVVRRAVRRAMKAALEDVEVLGGSVQDVINVAIAVAVVTAARVQRNHMLLARVGAMLRSKTGERRL